MAGGIEFTNLSYEEVNIKPNSIIYCDIPYYNTSGYNVDFDHKKIYEWAKNQTELVFISEYYMPEEDFICIASISKNCTLARNVNDKKTTEKLFIPATQEELYRKKVIKLF